MYTAGPALGLLTRERSPAALSSAERPVTDMASPLMESTSAEAGPRPSLRAHLEAIASAAAAAVRLLDQEEVAETSSSAGPRPSARGGGDAPGVAADGVGARAFALSAGDAGKASETPTRAHGETLNDVGALAWVTSLGDGSLVLIDNENLFIGAMESSHASSEPRARINFHGLIKSVAGGAPPAGACVFGDMKDTVAHNWKLAGVSVYRADRSLAPEGRDNNARRPGISRREKKADVALGMYLALDVQSCIHLKRKREYHVVSGDWDFSGVCLLAASQGFRVTVWGWASSFNTQYDELDRLGKITLRMLNDHRAMVLDLPVVVPVTPIRPKVDTTLDINKLSESQFKELLSEAGIGATVMTRILQKRPFESETDFFSRLTGVPGVGPIKASRLRALFRDRGVVYTT